MDESEKLPVQGQVASDLLADADAKNKIQRLLDENERLKRGIRLEQKLDVSKVGPNRWRVICLVGRAIVFYGEAGSDVANFVAKNELAEADLGEFRAIGQSRHLVVGFGGKATVSPKEGGGENEVQVNFDGIALAL